MPILLRTYLQNKFGEKVWKLPLDPRFPCPHINPKLSKLKKDFKQTGPCIYCDQSGSSAVWTSNKANIREQLFKSAMLMSGRYKVKHFIAYLQANTTTNADAETLDRLYSDIIKFPGIVGLAISTRPDAIDKDIMKVIAKYNKKMLVWLELGAQSMFNKSLTWIQRGHNVQEFINGVELSKSFGIKTIGHIIFGLPTETHDETIVSFKKFINTGLWGYKIHALHIVENTRLAKIYKETPFKLLSKQEYVDLVIEALKLTPKDMVIHRLTAETNDYKLVAPLWVLNKQDIIFKLKPHINNIT